MFACGSGNSIIALGNSSIASGPTKKDIDFSTGVFIHNISYKTLLFSITPVLSSIVILNQTNQVRGGIVQISLEFAANTPLSTGLNQLFRVPTQFAPCRPIVGFMINNSANPPITNVQTMLLPTGELSVILPGACTEHIPSGLFITFFYMLN
jgi:hypothetical protein